jgi:hypothetical protein
MLMKLQFLDFPHKKGFCFEGGANEHALFWDDFNIALFFHLD